MQGATGIDPGAQMRLGGAAATRDEWGRMLSPDLMGRAVPIMPIERQSDAPEWVRALSDAANIGTMTTMPEVGALGEVLKVVRPPRGSVPAVKIGKDIWTGDIHADALGKAMAYYDRIGQPFPEASLGEHSFGVVDPSSGKFTTHYSDAYDASLGDPGSLTRDVYAGPDAYEGENIDPLRRASVRDSVVQAMKGGT